MTKCLSIITRTQNREAGLHRCYQNLLEQSTSREFEWIIVNDGGKPISAASFKNTKFPVTVINNEHPLGRSAAANKGFEAAAYTYGCLLDDDDTFSLNFIEEMTQFLEQSKVRDAAACYSMQVVEKIEEGRLVEIERYSSPFNCEAITLGKMAAYNRVDSNAVVFKLSRFNEVGGFDESMDLMEDYDLFLRLLMVTDIDVLPKPLAFHHIRPDASDDYKNTVLAMANQHQLADARYRNRKYREDLAAGRHGLGYLLQSAQTQAEAELFRKEWRNSMQSLVRSLNPKHFVARLFKRKG